ncbi:S-adenosylmethionine-dependent methyltransferase [Ascoidea rubescens DSM 1968]|uniref:Modification methylase HemK n=1 Tax=Ascoidea rubescens DSM 1968 TaxID=1344418 RepID=A0A1D2VCI2_9ASCO|nr:modification methylase HemK [Ascoidea rubescens DSM 1968]ODV59434.1 modification methylase HemK [Ascoidea rubescens DSM 1968]
MPRLSPKLFKEAAGISHYLPYLLPACRSITSSVNELNWIKNELPKHKWLKALKLRKKLVPLQYILGNQPFGNNLSIKCEKNVLIPRNDTEDWVIKLSNILSEYFQNTNNNNIVNKPFTILDVCTGSGCIPLLLGSEIRPYNKQISLIGIDISNFAINLALKNLKINQNFLNLDSRTYYFSKQDLFNNNTLNNIKNKNNSKSVDLLVSNPPYIHSLEYTNNLQKSVKLYEPKLALLGHLEFYNQLLYKLFHPHFLNNSPNAFIFELGNDQQVQFTKNLLQKLDKSNQWNCGLIYDSNNLIRCIVGWKTDLNILSKICDKLL